MMPIPWGYLIIEIPTPAPKKLELPHPVSTLELVNAYQKGRGNIKTLIVLEKDNYRLAKQRYGRAPVQVFN